jgi:TRAP-type C4-dicarboxylate transport system substrate-binding protein
MSLRKLTDEDREIVLQCFKDMSAESFNVAEANEAKYQKMLKDDYGVEVIVFTPEEVAVQAKFVRETTWPKLEEHLTKELMDNLKAEVGM